mgnify:CR=1 FL=1
MGSAGADVPLADDDGNTRLEGPNPGAFGDPNRPMDRSARRNRNRRDKRSNPRERNGQRAPQFAAPHLDAEGNPLPLPEGAVPESAVSGVNSLGERDGERLHKVLAQQGLGSRRDMEALIEAGEVEVNGVKVNAKNAAIVPANRTLANDAYVRVKGTYADTGELVASQVEIRRKADSDFITEVSLNGSITDYVSLASFKVRGVPVDAGSATLSNCPATLSNGLYVETAGNVGKTGVVATKVSCKDAPEAASIEVRGVASAVDPTALKFTLTSGGKAFDVQWNSQTRFSGVAAATLNGAQVKVEGYLKSGILIAKKISK